MRIISFSGGVESTSLLQFYEDGDLVVTYKEDGYRRESSYRNLENINSIARYYGIKIYYYDVKIANPFFQWHSMEDPGVDYPPHQKHWIFPALYSLAMRLGKHRCKGILYGDNWDDINFTMGKLSKKATEHWEKAWPVLSPDIPMIRPLLDKSKKDCWDAIPNKVKPYVKWCPTTPDKPCNQCKKCDEFNYLVLGKRDRRTRDWAKSSGAFNYYEKSLANVGRPANKSSD